MGLNILKKFMMLGTLAITTSTIGFAQSNLEKVVLNGKVDGTIEVRTEIYLNQNGTGNKLNKSCDIHLKQETSSITSIRPDKYNIVSINSYHGYGHQGNHVKYVIKVDDPIVSSIICERYYIFDPKAKLKRLRRFLGNEAEISLMIRPIN